MESEEVRLLRLATLLGVSAEKLSRYVVRPLADPLPEACAGWNVPELCRELHSITDGFILFGPDRWNGFRLWGAADYRECSDWDGPIFRQATEWNLFPVYGSIPHLASVSLVDGKVLATDWEIVGQVQHGWGKVIAGDLSKYVRTVIEVREAYGDEGMPADWWRPYASHGNRYDQGQ